MSVHATGAGGRIGVGSSLGAYVRKVTALEKVDKDQDPREALLKYAKVRDIHSLCVAISYEGFDNVLTIKALSHDIRSVELLPYISSMVPPKLSACPRSGFLEYTLRTCIYLCMAVSCRQPTIHTLACAD